MKQYIIQKVVYADNMEEALKQVDGGITVQVLLNENVGDENYLGFRLTDKNSYDKKTK